MRLDRLGRKGSALTEFAVVMVALLVTIFGVVDILLEIYVRAGVERSINAAATSYAQNADVVMAEAAMRSAGGGVVASCLSPLSVRLVDAAGGVDMLDPGVGRPAIGDATDASAVLARLEVSCFWTRLAPLVSVAIGASFEQTIAIVVRPGV